MSGLSYLFEYGESEESESETTELAPKKLKLPTPDLSKVTVVSAETHFDDPDKHHGRTRTFPHVRGNWATYVYVNYPDDGYINELLNKFKPVLQLMPVPYFVCENLHISVSKTVVLKYHLISTFVSALQEITSSLNRFNLCFDSVEVYTNEEKLRTFVALKADCLSNKFLINITQKVDDILRDFKLPTFYEDPSFHMSILWFNGNQVEIISEYIRDLNDILNTEKELHSVVNIQKLDCKIGNKYYQFQLE